MPRNGTYPSSKRESIHDPQHAVHNVRHEQGVSDLHRRIDVTIRRIRLERVNRLHLLLNSSTIRTKLGLRPPNFLSVSFHSLGSRATKRRSEPFDSILYEWFRLPRKLARSLDPFRSRLSRHPHEVRRCLISRLSQQPSWLVSIGLGLGRLLLS